MKFSIKEALRKGHEITRANWKFLIGAVAINFILNYIPDLMRRVNDDNSAVTAFVLFVMSVAAWCLRKIYELGLIKVNIDLLEGKKPQFDKLFSTTNLLLKGIAGDILYGLIVLGGLILLVVPGIIFAIKYQYYNYLIADKGMGPIEALRHSGEMTQGVKWRLLGFNLLLGLINLAGALALVIGLFYTIPLTLIASTFVYRLLSKSSKA